MASHLTDKVSYIRGLMEGMKFDTESDQGKLLDKIVELLDDMAETLKEANGVGLAAPQVGILRRVVIVDVGDEIVELVNPTLVEKISLATTKMTKTTNRTMRTTSPWTMRTTSSARATAAPARAAARTMTRITTRTTYSSSASARTARRPSM